MKELAIGEIGEIDGVRVRCVEYVPGGEYDCLLCTFSGLASCGSVLCLSEDRSDKKEAHYEEVKS